MYHPLASSFSMYVEKVHLPGCNFPRIDEAVVITSIVRRTRRRTSCGCILLHWIVEGSCPSQSSLHSLSLSTPPSFTLLFVILFPPLLILLLFFLFLFFLCWNVSGFCRDQRDVLVFLRCRTCRLGFYPLVELLQKRAYERLSFCAITFPLAEA